MQAAELLQEIRAAGLMLDLAPDGLRVSPKHKLTDTLRQKILAHKPQLLAALAPETQGGADPAPDLAVQIEAARLMCRVSSPDRKAFALRNHAEAIRHFRKMAGDTERLAAMYRAKVAAHVAAARQHLDPADFATWLTQLEGHPGAHPMLQPHQGEWT